MSAGRIDRFRKYELADDAVVFGGFPDPSEEGEPCTDHVRHNDVVYVAHNLESVGYYCPCGCDRWLVLPVHPEAEGDGWLLTLNDNKLSLSPSVLDRICNAHYFIRELRVDWCQ